MKRGGSFFKRGAIVIGLTALLGIGCASEDKRRIGLLGQQIGYNVANESLSREQQDKLRVRYRLDRHHPCTVSLGFEEWKFSEEPVYVRGVQDCGVCIMYNDKGQMAVGHYGLKSSDSSRWSVVGFDYVGEMVDKFRDSGDVKVRLIGGDGRYLKRVRCALQESGVSDVETVYLDETCADGKYRKGNRKDILAYPDGEIILKKKKKLERIK